MNGSLLDKIKVSTKKLGNCNCNEFDGYWDGDKCPTCGKKFIKVHWVHDPALDYPTGERPQYLFSDTHKTIEMKPKEEEC